MFYYFGFGSNMSMLSLRAKGVEPRASTKAVLHGWQLRFNVQHFFRHEGGVGNIENTGHPDDRVLGVLHECPDEALSLLDQAEAYGHGYNRIEIEVEPDNPSAAMAPKVSALTYVGMPQFIDNDCRPSRRYLNIVLEGGRQAGLDGKYLESLANQPFINLMSTQRSRHHPETTQHLTGRCWQNSRCTQPSTGPCLICPRRASAPLPQRLFWRQGHDAFSPQTAGQQQG